jgi:hypothetical protein
VILIMLLLLVSGREQEYEQDHEQESGTIFQSSERLTVRDEVRICLAERPS